MGNESLPTEVFDVDVIFGPYTNESSTLTIIEESMPSPQFDPFTGATKYPKVLEIIMPHLVD